MIVVFGENPEFVGHERDSATYGVLWEKNQVIKPFFFEGYVVNGNNYLEMLRSYFIPQLEQLGLIENTVFQQDDAPCHFVLHVRQFLHEKFTNRWIRRGGPFSLLPRSPNLIPFNFFLWGNVKINVYLSKSRSLENLQARIIGVIASIMLENVFWELQNRICFVTVMMVDMLKINENNTKYKCFFFLILSTSFYHIYLWNYKIAYGLYEHSIYTGYGT